MLFPLMVWLLQLANLRSPCLGLTSNELRELLFTCIGGTISEASQFRPTNEKRPSRHVPLPHDSPCESLTVLLVWELSWDLGHWKPGLR